MVPNDRKSRHVYLFRIVRIEITYGNFTNRGQPYMPRFAAARWDFGDDPFQREVFSDVARDCIRAHTRRAIYVHARACVRVAYIRGGGCLWDGRMCRCDNGLKHDAAGFHCSSVPALCLLFAMPTRQVIALIRNSIWLEIIFPSKKEKKIIFFLIEKFTSFLILRTSILAAVFRMKQVQRFFF